MAIAPRNNPQTSPIISSIEVSYFRTFYKITFSELSDLNIFFGENDVGKSNIMRALNLFFNDEVEPGFEFDFDIDFSAKRASEADAPGDVRSFAYVKIWFNSPPGASASPRGEFLCKENLE